MKREVIFEYSIRFFYFSGFKRILNNWGRSKNRFRVNFKYLNEKNSSNVSIFKNDVFNPKYF